MLTRAGLFPMLGVFNLGLVLSSLAFLAASLLTFLITDFSQPKRKTKALAIWCLLFLAAAWSLSAAWPALRPGPKEKLDTGIWVVGKEAFLSTNRGLYRYDAESDRFKKIIRLRSEYPHSVASGGKVLYVVGYGSSEGPALWAANTDGSDKRLLLGSGQGDARVYRWFQGLQLSPGGKTAAFLYQEFSDISPRGHEKLMASIGTDGTGLRKLAPLEPDLVGDGYLVGILGWLESPDGLLMMAASSQRGAAVLWRYDLSSGVQTRLFESPWPASFVPNPAGDSALMITRKDRFMGPIDISLLDLKTGATTPITTIERPGREFLWNAIQHSGWSGDGDRVGFLIRREGGLVTPAVYSGNEHRFVMGPDIRLQETPDSSHHELRWTGDGAKLVVTAVVERSLYFLGLDLALTKEVPVPASVGERFMAWPVGDAVLVSDQDEDAVWRLDLTTETWKKIW